MPLQNKEDHPWHHLLRLLLYGKRCMSVKSKTNTQRTVFIGGLSGHITSTADINRHLILYFVTNHVKICDKRGRPHFVQTSYSFKWGKGRIIRVRLWPSVSQYICNVCVRGWMWETVWVGANAKQNQQTTVRMAKRRETEESLLGLFKAWAQPTQVCCIAVTLQPTFTCNKEDNSEHQQ